MILNFHLEYHLEIMTYSGESVVDGTLAHLGGISF